MVVVIVSTTREVLVVVAGSLVVVTLIAEVVVVVTPAATVPVAGVTAAEGGVAVVVSPASLPGALSGEEHAAATNASATAAVRMLSRGARAVPLPPARGRDGSQDIM
ncbi:hypothetical protein [Candidatus Spongiisocius sp.]|uniref:hypothetical protein n=1 Tax=Candidatus Spongiisocius sp. TaxID=3101273 RepID=UPI003B5BAA3B